MATIGLLSAIIAILSASACALRVPSPAAATARRDVLHLAAAAALLPPSSAQASIKYIVPISDDLKLLFSKAKAVRGSVRNGAAARRSLPMDPTPGTNNYGTPLSQFLS